MGDVQHNSIIISKNVSEYIQWLSLGGRFTKINFPSLYLICIFYFTMMETCCFWLKKKLV